MLNTTPGVPSSARSSSFPQATRFNAVCIRHTGTISISIAKMDPLPPSGLIMRPANPKEIPLKTEINASYDPFDPLALSPKMIS